MERLDAVLEFEPAFVIFGLALIAWVVYKTALRKVSEERHGYLRRDFRELGLKLLIALAMTGFYWTLGRDDLWPSWLAMRVVPYAALLTLVAWLFVFVKTASTLIYEYLILLHMRVGVPVLIVNIATLVLWIVVSGWVAISIFGVDLAPLLATSAMFSIVLGLALQDTLGNLFAGIAMQFDWKPFEIGDWIEVNNAGSKWLGEVHEISWRATTLLGPLDERITLPNKVMAQSQINSYSTKERPMIRTLTFRFAFDAPIERVKDVMSKAAATVPLILKHPRPFVLIPEATESWVAYRLVYFIRDFGSQWRAADAVNAAVLDALNREGISLAITRLAVTREGEDSSKRESST